ncbi:hypothetical protein M409DRAFT_16058 [Zasmidium cellare ATCC 36951]|uniref:SMP-30/Gluconolactonase/LRE-like region domain-containing protein n=1 Tax=Zasmidium cellare ATCC 36951 TaxID=1080233 RepID=A0A6A6D822_ZASCE|nr:uncharacterized protein M409DRAFT_16058 [Zasmidium cellare ATCC 36951]KAF2173786.1 hypothetical protein M409DRAFT_16058 [Zasmidium cellare ATCC 36951]
MSKPGPKTRRLFTFQEHCFIENIAIRHNGHLLLTTFREGELYNVDPDASSPEPQLVARLPDVNALTGIVEIAPDVWAVAGGMHAPQPFVFDNGTMKVFRVDLNTGIENPSVEKVADAPDAPLLNGMCGVEENPHILLSVDSHGKVWRIDTKTGKVDAPLEHANLAPSEAAERLPIGANGAKTLDGYLYWTNSGRETFCRVKIDGEGVPQGEVEVVAKNEGAGKMIAYDDFDFDRTTGVAYLTQHGNAVHKVDQEGKLEVFAGGGEDRTFEEPTALAVSKDGKRMFVACAGKMGEFKGNVIEVEV